MKVYGDYHTHTKYSDGLSTVRENVIAARAAGLKELGVSDHGYANYSLSMTPKKVIKQREEINRVREEFKDIKIFSSIEADIISLDGTADMSVEEMADFDYIICGFHRWTRPKSFYDFRKFYWACYMTYLRAPKPQELVRNTDATIKMLRNYPIAIFPHMNSGSHVDEKAVAEACADLNVFVELNVKHIIRNLGNAKFEKLLETNAKFIMSSDAHKAERIGKLDKVIDFIKPYNCEDRIVNLQGKTPDFRTYRNWR